MSYDRLLMPLLLVKALFEAALYGSSPNFGQHLSVSRSSFYELEKRFVNYGLPGLLFFSDSSRQHPGLEQLCLLAKTARPSLSYTAIHRLAQAVPITKDVSTPKLVSAILQSHGYGISDMKDDAIFRARIQRTLDLWSILAKTPIKGRDAKRRKATFILYRLRVISTLHRSNIAQGILDRSFRDKHH